MKSNDIMMEFYSNFLLSRESFGFASSLLYSDGELLLDRCFGCRLLNQMALDERR